MKRISFWNGRLVLLMVSLRQEIVRLATESPELRRHLVPLLREARVTPEKLYLTYKNLGDFGGTIPIQDSWLLEVTGPTFPYKDELKRLGLRFDPRTRTWRLYTELLKYTNARNSQEFAKVRGLQDAAYPGLQALVKAHNDKVEAEIKQMRGPESNDTRGFLEMIRRHQRMSERLKEQGLTIEWKFDSGREPRVFVGGNTYAFRDLLRKYGFQWDSLSKKWWMPGDEYRVVGDEWMGKLIQQLPKQPAPPAAPGVGPFSAMSDHDLTDFLDPEVQADMEANEWYDGELHPREAMAQLKLRVRRMSPADQVTYYNKILAKFPALRSRFPAIP